VSRRDDAATDSGLSLIELLVAIALMGIVVVGIVGLLGTLVMASDEAKTQAESEALARSAAEDVKAWVYADCDPTGAVATYDAARMLLPRRGTGLEQITQDGVKVEYALPTPTGLAWGDETTVPCRQAVAHRVSITVTGQASNAKATGVVVKRRPCLLSQVPDPSVGNCL
jgi:prepilin-type N-terminal cleavage/methylation domain-containing protein